MANKSKKSTTNNSNASASAFGWDFQANAAILLMLENIERAESIKVEAQTEDIEITLNNKNIIYSQAKSLEDINSTSNLLSKLKDGIRTLNNADNNGDAESLIYITNHHNPFNDKNSVQHFLFRSKLSYNELPKKCKEKIINIINKNNYSIDTSKLKVYVLPFYGTDKDNRDKAIKSAVAEFLEKVGIYTEFTPKKMLEIWQRDFFHNSTIPDNTIRIKKKEMMWAMIVEICNFNNSDICLQECDDAIINEIEHHYKSIIDNKAEEFEFLNKVLGDYEQYRQNSGMSFKEGTEKFINEEYVKYLDEFNIEKIDDYSKKCLVQLILKTIINKRLVVDKVKKGANI